MTAFIGNFCFFPAIFLLNFFIKKAGWRCAYPAYGHLVVVGPVRRSATGQQNHARVIIRFRSAAKSAGSS
ncbi:hypothetical protein C1166_03515 [Enterobacter bugandensis]|uniref:Uncharacterized protein n=1 Tax=Enterobacter bugandensis TaxID=881260 RepID=A0ABX4VHZ1_9ENTR|nr:hypothetical protein C1166_03515 [Enterobacter bugandensis]PNF54455.1 hypothetical protein C1169_07965 [Enterobacter bugandensis]PNF63242.1 hypothetical protein C1168_07965 [Enterobacter bugandensis]PNF67881.1 hypothetical protein C1167_07965 [Enterobacter bugandensis]RKN90014.1 hypothetical protein D8O00_12105 [Enterobacter bugandensis]